MLYGPEEPMPICDAQTYRDWTRNEHPRAHQMHRHDTGRCVEDGDDCEYCEREASE